MVRLFRIIGSSDPERKLNGAVTRYGFVVRDPGARSMTAAFPELDPNLPLAGSFASTSITLCIFDNSQFHAGVPSLSCICETMGYSLVQEGIGSSLRRAELLDKERLKRARREVLVPT